MIVDNKSSKYLELLRYARERQTTHQLTIGVHTAEGSAPARRGDVSIVDVALANEFGVPEEHIPERSFIRAWFDERGDFAREQLYRLVSESVQETGSEQRGLQRFALWAEADVRARIRAGISPPNANLTITLKKSSKPLIDRGQLIAAIRARIDGRLP